MVTERQAGLVQLLAVSDKPIPASELSKELQVSTKTVRNDIRQLNLTLTGLQVASKAGSGYYLSGDRSKIPQLAKEETTDHTFEILHELIDQESCDFYELADNFFISESTLDRLIRRLNEVIQRKNADWCIQRKNNLLFIPADESQRRSIYNLFLTEEIGEHKLSLAKYRDYFIYCDIEKLSQLVLDYHQQHHHHLNDFATIGFILHLAVLLERVHKENFLRFQQVVYGDSSSYQLMLGLVERLEAEMGVAIPEAEYPYIYRLYSGKGELEGGISEEELAAVIHELLQQVAANFAIDFSQDAKIQNYLGNHLAGLYRRAQSQQFLVNPLISEIKNKFPFIYNVTVYAAAYLQERLEITFPDDEIAYLALHFLTASENIHDGELRRILLVSPYGQGSLRLIKQQLVSIKDLSVEIQVKDSVLSLTEGDLLGVDLVVTTAPLMMETTIPTYRFSLMLTDQDLEEITKLLVGEPQQALRLVSFLSRELFFPLQRFDDREECIKFLSEKLIQQGVVGSEFTQQVLKREALSSTSFGNYYAIPHAIKRIAKKNAIAVCSLKQSLDWGGKKVRLVLLLAFNDESNDSFGVLFGELATIFSDSAQVRRLAKIDDFEAFIEAVSKVKQLS